MHSESFIFERTEPAAAGRHSTLSKTLHWGTVAVILIAVATVLLRMVVESKTVRIGALEVHRQAGLLVLLALVLRIGTRMRGGLADHSAQMPRYLRVAAMLGHWALYSALLAIPLLGWALSNAHGITISFLTIVRLPGLVAADPDLADTLTDLHLWASWTLLAFVTLHVAAALYHHLVRRDGVLIAMLPGIRALPPALPLAPPASSPASSPALSAAAPTAAHQPLEAARASGDVPAEACAE